MSNRTFSIDKDRELSPLEARISSFRRRLPHSLGRRKNSLEARNLSTTLRGYPSAMPKGKGRRRKANVDWESSGAEDSISNEAGSDGSTNGVGERGNANDSGHRIDHTRDGGPSKGKRGGLSQHKSKDSLGPWTEAVSQVVQNMEATHQAIHTLQEIFTSHSDNIEMIEQTRRRAKELEGACEEKDEKIRTQEAVIFALRNFDQKAKAEAAEAAAKVKEGKQSLDQEKKKLEDDRAKLEKRVTAAIAEEKLSLNLEAKKYEAQLSKIHEKREKERDDEFAQRKDENDKRAAATETERKRLSATVEEQQRIIDARSDELKRIKDQHDLLDRATDSYKRDLKDQEKELKLMKEEFALNSKSKDYFAKSFEQVYGKIEDISKYFIELIAENLEKAREELVAADSCFTSVPIEDSENSRDLRVAHAQRVISNALCEYIWKPFSSEITLLRADFGSLLSKISDEIDKSSSSGRAANAWTALTMRALQSLQADLVLPHASEFKESPLSTRSSKVVSRVSSVLSPLVDPSQKEAFQRDLHALVNSAISVWNDAQTGGLKIVVNPSLERARREAWRSQQFDPKLTDDTSSDIVSSTHPRIFTLFPEVIALEVAAPITQDSALPGSWPGEPDQSRRLIRTCLYPGRGLPECSPLVVRGKEDQKEREVFLEERMKELRNTRRIPGHGRKESKGSATS